MPCRIGASMTEVLVVHLVEGFGSSSDGWEEGMMMFEGIA